MLNKIKNFTPMLTDGKQFFDLSPESLIDYDYLELISGNHRTDVAFYTSLFGKNHGENPLKYCIVIDNKPYYIGFNSWESLQTMFYDKLNTIF